MLHFAKLFLIPSLVDMEQAEKDDLWRTEEEIKATEQDILQTARAAISKTTNGKSTAKDHNERGLESLVCTPAKRHSILHQRINLVTAILDAQEKEWQKGHIHANPDILRDISTKLSTEASEKARMLGASDEAYVRQTIRNL